MSTHDTTRAPWWRAIVAVLAAAVGGAVVAGVGCSSEPVDDSLCRAGESIFCRCPGGDPGTKLCDESGEGFGECGPCTDRPSSGPGQQGAGGFGAGPGVGGGGNGQGGVGGMGDVPLLERCDVNGDCQSGICRHNYCTIFCGAVSECPYPTSECVAFDANETYCMPSCDTAVDCGRYDAPPSRCGFTRAVDNWGVTVCAEWGEAHALMPDGTDCLPFDHPACNLGYQQRQSVCSEQGVCAVGCFTTSDCPDGQTCNSQGSLGQCQ